MPAKRTRMSDMVDVKEMEALLNMIKNAGTPENEAVVAVGYKNPASVLVEARKLGLVKRVVVMGLKGFIAEKQLSTTPKSQVFALNFEDAEMLFDALRKAREIWPKREAALKSLQARVAQHMTRL